MLNAALTVINRALAALTGLPGGVYSHEPPITPDGAWAITLPDRYAPYGTPTSAEIDINLTVLGELLTEITEPPTTRFYGLVEAVMTELRPLTIGSDDGFSIRLGDAANFRVVQVGEQTRWAATIELVVIAAIPT